MSKILINVLIAEFTEEDVIMAENDLEINLFCIMITDSSVDVLSE